MACFHRLGMDEQAQTRRSENHRYIFGLVAAGGRTKRPARYWLKIVLLWLVLVSVFTVVWSSLEAGRYEDGAVHPVATNSPSQWSAWLGPVFMVMAVVLMLGLVWGGRWRAKRALLAALQSPDPAALVATVTSQIASRLPDRDAYVAQVQALAYTVYGRAVEARQALRQVEWSSRAPIIASLGYFAEAWVVLLCDRNVVSARNLFGEAASRAAVNPRVPGAAAERATYSVNLAVCDVLSGDVLSGEQAARHVAVLEQAVSHHVSPYVRLLAAMGLAALMDATGNAAKASELRAFIANTAPHCAAFRLTPADFIAKSDEGGPVVPAYLTASATGAATGARFPSVSRTVGRVVLLWAALIVGFLLIYQLLSPR